MVSPLSRGVLLLVSKSVAAESSIRVA